MEPAEAREWWEVEHANTPATEPRRFHILSSAILPIYDKVMGSSGIQTVKIARAVLAAIMTATTIQTARRRRLNSDSTLTVLQHEPDLLCQLHDGLVQVGRG